MTYFKKTSMLNEKEKQQVADQCGKIMLGLLEGRHTAYIAEQCGYDGPWQVEGNIDEMLYTLRKRVGRWRYIKNLFLK